MRKLSMIAPVTGALVAALALCGAALAKQPGGGGTTPPAPSVRILAPLFGTAVIPLKPFTLIGSVTDPNGAGGGTCVVDWGDGTSTLASGSSISTTTSNCATMHAYSATGVYYITVLGSDANGFAAVSSPVLMIVV
jgi:hypothetical protein